MDNTKTLIEDSRIGANETKGVFFLSPIYGVAAQSSSLCEFSTTALKGGMSHTPVLGDPMLLIQDSLPGNGATDEQIVLLKLSNNEMGQPSERPGQSTNWNST